MGHELENVLLYSWNPPGVTFTIVSRSAEQLQLLHPDDLTGSGNKHSQELQKHKVLKFAVAWRFKKNNTPRDSFFSSEDVLNELMSAEC